MPPEDTKFSEKVKISMGIWGPFRGNIIDIQTILLPKMVFLTSKTTPKQVSQSQILEFHLFQDTKSPILMFLATK